MKRLMLLKFLLWQVSIFTTVPLAAEADQQLDLSRVLIMSSHAANTAPTPQDGDAQGSIGAEYATECRA